MMWVEIVYLTTGGGRQSVRCTLASSTMTEGALKSAGCEIVSTTEVVL